MSDRELILEVTSNMPETATFEEIIDAIYTQLKIEQGLDAVENGDVLTEKEVLEEIEKWYEAI